VVARFATIATRPAIYAETVIKKTESKISQRLTQSSTFYIYKYIKQFNKKEKNLQKLEKDNKK